MKRKITKLLPLLLSVLLIVGCFVACNQGGTTKAKLDSVTDTQIVMSIEQTDGNANAFDALKSLRDQGLISFDYTQDIYGAFITSINGTAAQNIESTATTSKGYAWTLYTSDMENAYEETTITVGETVCGMSAFGASSLTVKQGCLYVWVYEYYDYSW